MSPTTDSELPYIGDESITFPPRFTNSRNTSSSGARSEAERPTSNVCQVPRPMTGRSSPEEGMRRVSMGVRANVSPAADAAAAP
jgi:hypothetical protein